MCSLLSNRYSNYHDRSIHSLHQLDNRGKFCDFATRILKTRSMALSLKMISFPFTFKKQWLWSCGTGATGDPHFINGRRNISPTVKETFRKLKHRYNFDKTVHKHSSTAIFQRNLKLQSRHTGDTCLNLCWNCRIHTKRGKVHTGSFYKSLKTHR